MGIKPKGCEDGAEKDMQGPKPLVKDISGPVRGRIGSPLADWGDARPDRVRIGTVRSGRCGARLRKAGDDRQTKGGDVHGEQRPCTEL
jgi:hypothetical protein